jgi:hypothetical protein
MNPESLRVLAAARRSCTRRPSWVCSGAAKACEACRSPLLGKLAHPAAQLASTNASKQRQTNAVRNRHTGTAQTEVIDRSMMVQSL